eukprot:4404048-Prymnesium_polylepis.2
MPSRCKRPCGTHAAHLTDASSPHLAAGQRLQENSLLIEAIRENLNAGRFNDAIQYQLQLQQNLIHLGTVADEQPDVRKLAFARAPPQQPAASESGPAMR